MRKLFHIDTTDKWLASTSVSLNDPISSIQSYLSMIGNAVDQISIVSIANIEGIIIRVNKNFERISGYKKAELVGKNFRLLNSSYHSRTFWEDMRETISKGITWHDEIKNKAKDGTYFWVDTSIVPLFAEDGNSKEYLLIQNDVTQQKNAEEKLVGQIEITELAINAVEIGIWEWHVETKTFTCNEYLCKHFGWPISQTKVNGEQFISRLHPDDTFKLNLMRDKVLAGQSIYQNEYRIVLENGDVNYISTKGVVLRDDNGSPLKIIGASLNITDLKRNEEELKRKQGLLDLAIEAGEIGVYSWKGEGHRATTNKYMDMHFDMSLNELDFGDFFNLVHPQDKGRLQKALEDSFVNRKKFDLEYRIFRKDGSENHIAAKGNVICDDDNNVKEMVGIVLNITKQKTLEEELRTKNEVLNMAIEAGEIGVFEWDVETRKTTWNSFMHQHLGLPVEEFDGTDNAFTKQVHVDDREAIFKSVEKSIQYGKPVDIEYRAVLKNNMINYIKCRGILVNDDKGSPNTIVGVCLNITKLKQAEDELHTKQEILNLAIEAGEIGVFEWNIKNGVFTGNKYINQHYGFEVNRIRGSFDEFKEIIHLNDQAKIDAIIENNFDGKEKVEIDYRVILNDGRIHHIASSGILSRDDEGMAEWMVGIVLNVTKQKELEATLQASEKKFRSALHDSAIGMALVGVDGKYLEVNKALLDILGYEEEELLKMDIQAVTYPDDLEEDLQLVQKLISGRIAPYTLEKRYVHKDGSIIWGQLNGSVVRNDEGEVLYFIAQIQNITLRKQIDEKLQEHNQKLEAANNELESFSYSVSHDLRAPLRIINGYIEILREDFGDKINEDGTQIIDTIIYNANKMGHLIDDLLEFSRMNRKGIEKNVFEVDEMVREIVSELTGFERSREIDIKIGNLHAVFADSQMIRQVWYNLIQNAIKYTCKKPLAHIEIDSYKEHGSICFSIRDNGVGFNMKYAHKLFEVFQRLHSATEFEGTGVGLAIVKRIIDRHGGRIWVNAKENEGTTFYFTIPDSISK